MKSLIYNFFFKIEIYLACYMLEYNINNLITTTMTTLYLPEDNRSLHQNAYVLLFRILTKHYTDEIKPEMNESHEWKLTPTVDETVKMVHLETDEEHNPFFMLFGSYDQSTEVFSWRNNYIKNIIKEFIENYYHMTEYLGNASCFMTELFSDTVHIKNEDHVIIPTFIRMFHKAFRLVRLSSDDDEDKKYYYGLIKYDFEDHTDFEKFEIGLSLYRDSVDIRLLQQQQLENSENVDNTNT